MSELDDHDLLARYARENSEAAFTTLVERHLNLVFATALRSAGNAHAAEEISQAVFIILANKAGKISRRVVLSGWLYQTARLTAANFRRGEIRRQKREQEAFMQSSLNESANETWAQIAPILDEALGQLGARDRNAIVLRFFENKNLREVGRALGASEDAAKMRVNRALKKLRTFFGRRGVKFSAAAIAGGLSANSIHAAPAGLVKTISAVALAKGATAGGSTLTLAKGALKIMAWIKVKTGIIVGVAAILAIGSTTVVVKEFIHPKKIIYPDFWTDDPNYWRLNNPPLASYPPVFVLRPTRFSGAGGGIVNGDRFLQKDVPVQMLIAEAYEFRDARIIFPHDLPESRPWQGYDLMLTMPDHPREILREEIKKRFGFTAHTETRMTNVLVLKVKIPNAPGLKISTSQRSSWIGRQYGADIKKEKIDWTIGWMENALQKPTVNQTGLAGFYDININWKPESGQSEPEAFKQALLDQLGLELVPTNMPIEMLVVEKIK